MSSGDDNADGDGGVLLLLGGRIPDGNMARLRELGVDGVFPVGSFTGEMVGFIRERVERR